jgi:cytoskeletal protein CcmA (bactofilin family)
MRSRAIRLAILGVIAVTVLSVGAVAAGSDVGSKVLSGQTVTVAAGDSVDHDLYAFAGEVVVDGDINGDLVAFAGMVTVNGNVEGDIVTGAGQVVINGTVGGDVRAGVGDLVLNGRVGEDLLAGSGTIRIGADGEVGEDLIFASGVVRIAGTVEGSVLGSASRYQNTGTVGGSEQVTVERPGPAEPEQPLPSEPAQVVGDGLRHFVTVILLGALAMWLVPRAVGASEETLRRRPLASAGIGIGVLVGFIIQVIAVILIMILGALAFGAVTLNDLAGIILWSGVLELMITTFALVISISFIVDFVVGLALARLVIKRASPDWASNRWKEALLLVAGTAVVVLVTSLPEIGPLAKLVVIVLGLGAMFVALGEWWQRRGAAGPPTPAAAAPEPPADAPAPAPEPPAPAPPAATPDPPAAI